MSETTWTIGPDPFLGPEPETNVLDTANPIWGLPLDLTYAELRKA